MGTVARGIIELLGNEMYSGELGPSTIVGFILRPGGCPNVQLRNPWKLKNDNKTPHESRLFKNIHQFWHFFF